MHRTNRRHVFLIHYSARISLLVFRSCSTVGLRVDDDRGAVDANESRGLYRHNISTRDKKNTRKLTVVVLAVDRCIGAGSTADADALHGNKRIRRLFDNDMGMSLR